MESDIGYVVRATTESRHDCWLTGPRLGGHRTFATREFAERFASRSQANDAILVMVREEKCRGIIFTIEPAEQPAGAPSY
jgi:hypothetical protein